jgi:hypothetical protein
MGEDEEEGRRKRELIPLSYSDDEDEKPKKEATATDKDKDKKPRLTGREKEKRIMEIEDSIPRDKEKLFGWDVKWSGLNDVRTHLVFLPGPDSGGTSKIC